jgi:hypothetical protein
MRYDACEPIDLTRGIGRINSSEAPILEPDRVPVPSLPSRSPHDGEALVGHPRPLAGAHAPAASIALRDADAAFSAASSGEPPSPAVLADDGRGTVTMLNEVRDRADGVVEGLDQLEAAGAGLAQVQALVGRLRDVAVFAVDRGLQPAERAALQRQVDQALTEIDAVAEQTLVDEALLHKGRSATAGGERLAPFRALGTGALGLAGLAVRSSDQALAASGALEVATARLERSAGTLGSAQARLQEVLDVLVSPTTTATGEPALGGDTAARSATLSLQARLTGRPRDAIRAQAGLDAARVWRLLDAPPR